MEGEKSDNQPSTSAASDPSTSVMNASGNGEGEEAMEHLLEITDKILENKAKSMNLSSLNVRSILHHLIKYPSTIDVLLGIRENDDSLPSVRNTRSRKKQDEPSAATGSNTPEKFALRIEAKPPKNFLDLEYEEDDEYDDDYVEEKDSTRRDGEEAEESEDEDMDEEEEEEDDYEEEGEAGKDQQNKSQNRAAGDPDTTGNLENAGLEDSLFGDLNNHTDEYSMHMTLNDTRPGSAALVHTLDNVVVDDDYRNFVISLKCPAEDIEQQANYDIEDDAEDEDYNVCADNLNVEDWDETRQDKTTHIPRHELKGLMMDTLLAEKEIPINIIPGDTIDESRKLQKQMMNEAREKPRETHSDESCSLLVDAPVKFRPGELAQLRTQLEQHVQLLTQFVVTCHHDDELAHVRNSAQTMMNELDNIRQQRLFNSVLDTPNLDMAIRTCHEIYEFPPVSKAILSYANPVDGYGGMSLRPEAAEVLSRSGAIRYPGLLPPCQPVYIHKPLPFLMEEDVMLAVALLQFSYLPRRAEKGTIDRYSMIHEHCLPAREAFKIRNHLKSMRKESKNPIHEILQAAEMGICKITLPAKEWKRIETPIYTWPAVSQPAWYRLFKKTYNVTEDQQIHRKEEATMVLTPLKPSFDSFETNAADGNDHDDFVGIGTGSDGRKIIIERERLEELIKQLSEEKSSSKRRKNPTPMKLSVMMELERGSEVTDNSNSKTTTSENESTSRKSKAARRLTCTRDPKEQISLNNPNPPSTSSHVYDDCVDYNYGPSDNVPIAKKNNISDNASRISRTMKFTEIPDADLYHINNKADSCHSFPIPPTPGRRSPDEHDDYFMDLETNSLLWTRPPYSIDMGNPRTPRGYSAEPEYTDPIDFSSMNDYEICDLDADIDTRKPNCQRPMGYSAEIDEFSNPDSISDAYLSPSYNREDADAVIEDDLELVEEECYEDGVAEGEENLFSLETEMMIPLEESANKIRSRKRTRAEMEAMGCAGFNDETIYENQKETIMRKVIEDISQRLFMHKDTLQQFQETIFSEEFSEIEKVSRIMLVLKNHRELLSLVLLYAPPEAIVSDYDLNFNALAYKEAVEMIMAIERYCTAIKRKPPPRSLFAFIQNFLVEDPNLSDEEAARKFHRLFGRDRPLWEKLQASFRCLPNKRKTPPLERFEYIDLTNMEAMSKKDLKSINSRFETIDSIEEVMGPSRPQRNDPPSKLIVKGGEFCIQNEDESLIQLEVTERHWTMNHDVRLLKGYNEALKSVPDFEDSMIPPFVTDLPFGAKSIVARLKYLLEELKKMEDEGDKKD